jgi:hypothetical protein
MRERKRKRERERERDTYTINCVNEKQSQQEVTSANATIDSGDASPN